MRRRGDRVTITNGKYTGRNGVIDSNVHQRTVDYPNDLSNGFHVMLDSGELVTVRWDQVESKRHSRPVGERGLDDAVPDQFGDGKFKNKTRASSKASSRVSKTRSIKSRSTSRYHILSERNTLYE